MKWYPREWKDEGKKIVIANLLFPQLYPYFFFFFFKFALLKVEVKLLYRIITQGCGHSISYLCMGNMQNNE